MKIQWKKLIICILIPLAVGGLSAFITKDNMKFFDQISKPPLAPPGWLFPVAWSILYILMGIASYMVVISNNPYRIRTALTVYGLQLLFNFIWSPVFFNAKLYLGAFAILLLLLILIIFNTILFYRINKLSGYLLIPYIVWVTFAAYLNYGIYILN